MRTKNALAPLVLAALVPGCALFETGDGARLLGLGVDGEGGPSTGLEENADADLGAGDELGDGDLCASECRFSTYNLDVQPGDAFVLSRFVACAAPLALHRFAYEGDETWHLDDMNADLPILVADADATGGDDGRYRVLLVDADGEEVDHLTIRVGHGTESDIGPGDDAPRAAGACGPEEGASDDADEGAEAAEEGEEMDAAPGEELEDAEQEAGAEEGAAEEEAGAESGEPGAEEEEVGAEEEEAGAEEGAVDPNEIGG